MTLALIEKPALGLESVPEWDAMNKWLIDHKTGLALQGAKSLKIKRGDSEGLWLY